MGEMMRTPRSSAVKPDFPAPPMGVYGSGHQHEAETWLWAIEETEWNHHFDKEGEFAPYWRFKYKIVPADGPTYRVDELVSFQPGSGSPAIARLEAAGVPLVETEDENGDPCVDWDLQQAAPRPVGAIEMAEPRTYTSNKDGLEHTVHGNILAVIGTGD